MRGNPALLGNNVLGNQLAQMQNLIPPQGYQGVYQQPPYMPNHPIMQQPQIPQIADEPFNPGVDDR